MNKAN